MQVSSLSGINHTTYTRGESLLADIRFVRPIDQPTGNFRLLDWLESNFLSNDYVHFRCLTAFAKIRPFYKLHTCIQTWKQKNHSLEAIIGIDHKGTSYQALQYVLTSFDITRILHVDYSTFHPKLYIFYGMNKATAYYGSGNFTSGGLETNFEGGTIFDFDLPADQVKFNELLSSYSSLISSSVPCTTILTQNFLDNLLACGCLMDETKPVSRAINPTAFGVNTTGVHTIGEAATATPLFAPFSIKPARSIPANIMVSAAARGGITPVKATQNVSQAIQAAIPSVAIPIIPGGFVIQLAPHDNGEIFLSKQGINQNPAFFGYPFTGLTVPKKSSNPAYPQRIPDPIVNIRVFDATGALVHTENSYPLNMVYYASKSEIRITITPSILSGLHYVKGDFDYPLLVMKVSSVPNCDYDLDFYKSGSADYNNFLTLCNQTLPSGGKSVARRMGWF